MVHEVAPTLSSQSKGMMEAFNMKKAEQWAKEIEEEHQNQAVLFPKLMFRFDNNLSDQAMPMPSKVVED